MLDGIQPTKDSTVHTLLCQRNIRFNTHTWKQRFPNLARRDAGSRGDGNKDITTKELGKADDKDCPSTMWNRPKKELRDRWELCPATPSWGPARILF